MKHYAGLYYHVYNRGANREPIFVTEENYLFLLRQIKRFLPDYAITFIAYCLMPNHYHFMIRLDADGALSPFLQRLFNSYTQAFNHQQNRSGTLYNPAFVKDNFDTPGGYESFLSSDIPQKLDEELSAFYLD